MPPRRTYKISSIFSTFGTDGRAPQRVFTAHRARPFRRDLSRWIIGMPEIPYHYLARSRTRFVRAYIYTRRIYNQRIPRGGSRVDSRSWRIILRIGDRSCFLHYLAICLSQRWDVRGRHSRTRNMCVPPFIYFLFNFAFLFRVSSYIDANVAKVALFSPSLLLSFSTR